MRFGLFIMGTRGGTYHDILAQIDQAEELGFDRVLLGERHFRHSDLMVPSLFTFAAAVAARTHTIRIAAAARILPFDHPIRVAEDAATVDILSQGRLDFGATRASFDPRCHAGFGSPLEEAAGRFREGLDIIIKAWTEDSFSYHGLHYDIPEVSVQPKPVQVPHPPVTLVAVSDESLEFAAQHGYSAYVGGLDNGEELARKFHAYRLASGSTANSTDLAVNRFIYVAESDDQARLEIEAPFTEFVRKRAPDLRAALARRYGAEANATFDRWVEDFLIVGSPETVAARLDELRATAGVRDLVCSLNYVTLDHDRCVRSMELFAREVMPALNAEDTALEEPRRDL